MERPMKQEAVVEIEQKHAAEMAVMHERLRASCAEKAQAQERLIRAEARADHLEFQLKRTEEVVAGQTARIQEIQSTAQRERVDLETEIKRLTFSLHENMLVRSREQEEEHRRFEFQKREREAAEQRNKSGMDAGQVVHSKMVQAHEALRGAVQIESLLISRTTQLVNELSDWQEDFFKTSQDESHLLDFERALHLSDQHEPGLSSTRTGD